MTSRREEDPNSLPGCEFSLVKGAMPSTDCNGIQCTALCYCSILAPNEKNQKIHCSACLFGTCDRGIVAEWSLGPTWVKNLSLRWFSTSSSLPPYAMGDAAQDDMSIRSTNPSLSYTPSGAVGTRMGFSPSRQESLQG